MNLIAFVSGLPSGSEVLLILVIVLVLFGAKKLPELSRSLGKSLGEFKKGKEDLEKEICDVKTGVREQVTEPDSDEKKEPKDPSLSD